MDNNELINRRRFFKKAAKGMLPMLGAFVAAPTVIMNTLTSCGDDCDGCEAACKDNCSNTCSNTCNDTCYDSCLLDCTYGCKKSCSDDCSTSCEGSSTGVPAKGNIDGHEYVDLGLSVLWATCNIGAESDTDLGDHYMFVYQDETDTDNWLKRVNNLGLKKGSSISGTYLDTAKNKWGSKWRMPTLDEVKELCKNCDVEIVENIGLKLTSKVNGNSITFPYSKHTDTDGSIYWEEDYWSGTIFTDPAPSESFYACSLEIKWFKSTGARATDYISAIYWYYEKGKSWIRGNNRIRAVAERNDGNVSTCNGSCTANCASDCTSTCKGDCKNDCKGNCYTACAKACSSGCSTECTTSCAKNCATGCSSGCTTTCADSCKAQTSQYCSNCASNCSSGCTTTCADACKAQTSQGCSNCATQCSGDCNHECTYGCGRQCHVSCGGQCSGKCGGNCYVECVSYAKNTPCASCGGTCRSACNENCTYDCYSTCKSIGYK